MTCPPLFADAVAHVLDENWLGPVTKYQILVVLAAGIVAALLIPLANKMATGEPVRGPFWNALEGLLLYLRDEVVRPNIHSGHDHHPGTHSDADSHEHEAREAYTDHEHYLADKYLPFLWTLFLFILVCNLLGMIPFLGSPTASISVTAVLALVVFLVIQVSALGRLGLLGYATSFVPSLSADNPLMWVILVPVLLLIIVIEFAGIFIRGAVLAIRLFANLFAGHVALGVILAFAVGANGSLNIGGGIAAVLMGTALSVLELFVAFLQAFVFVLLTSIFLGLQLNPEH
jgi:F-type H+-transporting ATPase subunit a